MVSIFLLSSCAQNTYQAGTPYVATAPQEAYAPSRYYAPPGPPDDPWGPYIVEAAARYSVPQQWIRAVIAQESGGEEQAVSPVGAMGLMQLMPETYDDLRDSNGLGADPFDPHNNILAGTAYIREMYDRYGAPGFLAAYNAGPDRLDSYLAGESDLPDETVNYLAAVTPNLGNSIALTGPLAVYASNGAASAGTPNVVAFAEGCDVNAAYDPDHPCAPAPQASVTVASAQPSSGVCDADSAYDPDDPCTPAPQLVASASDQAVSQSASAGSCDADMAYDPDSPCTPQAQSGTAQASAGTCDTDAAYDPNSPCTPAAQAAPVQEAAAAPAASGLYQPATVSAAEAVPQPAPAPSAPAAMAGSWGIQVGAFTSPVLARAVAESAQAELPGDLGNAAIKLPPMSPFGGLVLYRARLVDLSVTAALNACSALNHRQLPCIVLRSSGS
jgi:D-alanyl-D-alanine carboxypeptidase